MLKERIKTSVILLLIANLIFLTFRLWFFSQNRLMGEKLIRYAQSLPVVEHFFPAEEVSSISKENLLRPRKFLVNDGSLWMAYYNTDIGFSPIESRTRTIITGLLRGETTAVKEIDYDTWESGLESMSIYVEYPVEFSTDMFCRIMGTDTTNIPSQIKSIKEFIIIPSSATTNVCILARDASKQDIIYAFIMEDTYQLPSSDLAVYTSSDGYYEPVFSTGLVLDSVNVSLSPLLLFSDSQPETELLLVNNLLTNKSRDTLLESFSFNTVTVAPYEDTDGALNYIANYGSAKIYPDSVFEYSAIEESKGILLDDSGDAYNVLNASIDFAEKTWQTVSSEPLSILVTSDLSDYNANKPYTFIFDYYVSGRPVEVELPSFSGRSPMRGAIEMTVSDGRLISYRQYMRSYNTEASSVISGTFVAALDDFVNVLDRKASSATVIEDIYIGYLDTGSESTIDACWLAKTSDGKIYRYTPSAEVTENELE